MWEVSEVEMKIERENWCVPTSCIQFSLTISFTVFFKFKYMLVSSAVLLNVS